MTKAESCFIPGGAVGVSGPAQQIVLLFVDYEDAFDSVELNVLQRALVKEGIDKSTTSK